MFDKHEHNKTELHQINIGSGIVVGRDQIIHNHLYGSVDYQQLIADIKDTEEELAETASKRTDLRLKRSAKLKKQRDDYKAMVFSTYEMLTRIPINTERLRQAKAHFDKGEFREAYAVLKVEEISAEVAQRKARREAALETVAAMDSDLADLANEFMLKAQLSLINPAAEGESKFKRTEQLFEQALAAARTAKVLFEYAKFLQEHNAFKQAEPLYQEALKLCRSFAEKNPKAFLPNLATTLNNLANLHSNQNAFGPALAAYEEALEIRRSLAAANPEAFLPRVADTLNNLGLLHSDQNSDQNAFALALDAYEEALKIYRSLVEANPEAFLQYVAITLNNLTPLYCQTNAFSMALDACQESLTIYRSLAEASPEAFLPDMAGSLNNLGLLHSDQNADQNAFTLAKDAYEEALNIRRSLAAENPEAFLPALTETLLNLSIFYFQAVPDQKKSVAYAEEARSILIPLCAKMPHLQQLLDLAVQLLADNAATPAA